MIHEQVQAMGVRICVGKEGPDDWLTPPWALLGGPADGSQPNIFITWRLLPTELKATLQYNKAKKSLTLKCRRAALDFAMERWCAFFGPPIELCAASGLQRSQLTLEPGAAMPPKAPPSNS